jgi:sirohydrochlorin ferrochelatase
MTSAALAQQPGPADRYARTLAEAEITARYNTQIEQQLRSQQSEIAALEQQIAGIDATAGQVESLLQKMFTQLEEFVKGDVPFFPAERAARLEKLRDLMARVDASPSERFRRVLEAYQIEMEYGRTMSAYKDKLADGREAEFVRLGRVSLYYRTADGAETGYWDNQQKMWVPDRNSARAIEQALAIAKEQKAPDIIVVPVPAPQGGRS